MALTLGFIGAGNINRFHMGNAQTLGLAMRGVADVNPAAAEAAAAKYGIDKSYQDYKELLGDKAIDAVVIGTPNRFHAEQAEAALNAGKHVFLEKPMAMNVGESDAILSAMKSSGKIVQMGMVNRFRNPVQAVKKFIDAGKCGQIYSGQAWWYRRRGIPGFGGWFTTKSMSGGGALIDIGVHLLDLALYLMDFPKPVAVSGQTYNIWKNLEDYTYTGMWGKPTPGGKKDVDDYALALIRFDNGATLNLNVSWALNMESLNPDQGVRLMGDQGGITLNGIDNPSFHGVEAGHIIDTKPQFAANNPGVDELAHFVDCIEHGKQPMPSAAQGRTVQSILDAIYRSGEEKREVRLD